MTGLTGPLAGYLAHVRAPFHDKAPYRDLGRREESFLMQWFGRLDGVCHPGKHV